MKTLVISDLDGTRLTAKENISAYSMENLNRMIDAGLHFTYATARSLNSAAKACWGLRQILPVILYNGALIKEPASGNTIYENYFKAELRRQICAILKELNISPLVYSFKEGKERVSWVRGRETDGMRRYLSRRSGDSRLNPVGDPQDLEGDGVFYYTFIDALNSVERLRNAVQQLTGIRMIFQQEKYQSGYWLEIMPDNTTKGEAAKVLKEHLKAERVVVFGDALNDRELFEMADERYAVGNAELSLKEIATGVIGYSEEDSVAKFLMQNFERYK